MVQRRPNRSAGAAGARNPFDSEDEPSPRGAAPSAPAYKNPFDDDEVKVSKYGGGKPKEGLEKNPFDDEAMWNRRNEAIATRRPASTTTTTAAATSTKTTTTTKKSSSPPFHGRSAATSPPPLRQDQGSPAAAASKSSSDDAARRRDRVKEKITAVSDDVSSLVRPRSRNLMGSGTGNNNRQLLFEEEQEDTGSASVAIQREQRKLAHARIERGVKSGESLEGESVQELEDYAVQKAEETTAATYKALKLAEEIKESATNTSVMLHEQGHQITKTHETAVDIDHELSRGEKLLGSLGGLFSRTWKPKKTRNITGPMITRGDSFKRKAYGMEQRAALGLNRSNSRGKTRTAAVADSSGSQAQSRIKNEFAKQDDALSDLSNVLGHLKEMTLDMGSEIGRQNEALGHVQDDIVELGDRVEGANYQGRKLLGK